MKKINVEKPLSKLTKRLLEKLIKEEVKWALYSK